ncbi:uncharacterized protein LOC130929986 isoform X4 [Corythoichthys intestinalis]|uniref:uncharacterized protein LOC130929986 isoform X4 n=1 Tax=Corythoichthys intestinalis TaxID=161448 RepID=UPI0025A4D48C|nr:uncharacterized protein LOC130929986 isoform X4 [Corythoichthys intestinalis]
MLDVIGCRLRLVQFISSQEKITSSRTLNVCNSTTYWLLTLDNRCSAKIPYISDSRRGASSSFFVKILLHACTRPFAGLNKGDDIMNPHKNVNHTNTSRLASSGTRQVSHFTQYSRVPKDFKESMIHIPMKSSAKPKSSGASVQATPEKAAQTRSAHPASGASKWKSSFKPIGQEDPEDNSQEQNSDEKVELYDPFDESAKGSPDDADNLDWQSTSQDRDYRVGSFSPQSGCSESHAVSTGWMSEKQSYSPDGNQSSRRSFSSESHQYSEAYRRERTKAEEMTMLGYRPTIQRVQLSPPTKHWDYEMEEPIKAAQPTQWKSSLKPIGQDDLEGDSREQNSKERLELYNPFDEPEKGENPEWHRESLEFRVCPSWQREVAHKSQDFSPENRLGESRISNMGQMSEKLSYTADRNGSSRRSFSPDSRPYSEIYRRERTKEVEEMTMLDSRRPVKRVQLSPPTLHQDYEMEAEPGRAEADFHSRVNMLERKSRKSVQIDKITINCDLCDIEVSNGQELEKHLESKIHWDTMEHIQEQNNYNDMAIAFLQDVMQYKSIKCSRSVDYSALQGLQENDHMTKVSLFHCSACQVLVSTTAAAVQNHISSSEHISNTKLFEAQRRRTSLDKADTIMKELQPQFTHFMKGFNHF